MAVTGMMRWVVRTLRRRWPARPRPPPPGPAPGTTTRPPRRRAGPTPTAASSRRWRLGPTPLSHRCFSPVSPPDFAHFTPFFARSLRLGARKPDSAKERRKNGGKRARNGRETVGWVALGYRVRDLQHERRSVACAERPCPRAGILWPAGSPHVQDLLPPRGVAARGVQEDPERGGQPSVHVEARRAHARAAV